MLLAETIALGAILLATGLYLMTMVAFHLVLRLRRRGAELVGAPGSAPTSTSFVTILKPLAGVDDDLEENLASFEALRWRGGGDARFSIVFGVASVEDPAYPVARRFSARYPGLARVVVTDATAAINPKIAQLVGMVEAAEGEILVVSDSNVRVPAAYLDDIRARLADSECGLVTHLFIGTGERTLGAALENLQLATMILPAVVLSACTGTPITVGKSMALRRTDLDLLGGFRAFGAVLAEDQALGSAFVEAGHRVETSFVAVENRNVRGSIVRVFDRHTRWAKMRRALAPTPFLFEPLFSPIIVALVAVASVPTRSVGLGFALAILVQTCVAHLAVRQTRGYGLAIRYFPLEVVRSIVLVACWIAAWCSRSVVWRGNRFIVGNGTVLARTIDSPARQGLPSSEVEAG